jgi:hypothetical protein
MGDHAEFKDHIEMQEYAERSGLDYTWAGTKLFAKRERTLPPDQFEVRPVRTKRGITMVGLFSAAITRAEREADAPLSGSHGGEAARQGDTGGGADGAIDGASQSGIVLRRCRCRSAPGPDQQLAEDAARKPEGELA